MCIHYSVRDVKPRTEFLFEPPVFGPFRVRRMWVLEGGFNLQKLLLVYSGLSKEHFNWLST